MTPALAVALVALALAGSVLVLQRRHLAALRQRLDALEEQAAAERARQQQNLLRLGEHSLNLERRLNRALEHYQWQRAEVAESAPESVRSLLQDIDPGADDSEAERALRQLFDSGRS